MSKYRAVQGQTNVPKKMGKSFRKLQESQSISKVFASDQSAETAAQMIDAAVTSKVFAVRPLI